MQPLRRQAVDALAALKSRRSPLTARELEVAALVAEGLTNREVAAQLRLSVRTAENHLLNVMNKLGFNNRAQVAGWFARTQSTNESLRSWAQRVPSRLFAGRSAPEALSRDQDASQARKPPGGSPHPGQAG
jgi:DNA-binding CsgD family transcriptional regulator